MIPVVLIAAIALAIIVLLIRHPLVPVNAVDDLHRLPQLLSVRLAALAGSMALAVPVIEQLQASLPQLEAVQQLAWLTQSQWYQTATGMLTLFVIVARAIKQPR